MNVNKNNDGFVLVAVMVLIVLASIIGGVFLASARGTNRTVEKWKAYDECLLAVQAALEAVNYGMYTNLLADIYENGNRRDALGVLANEDFTVDVVVVDGIAQPPAGIAGASVGAQSVLPSAITVTVSVASGDLNEVITNNCSDVKIDCDAVATHKDVTRRVVEIVTYDYNGTTYKPGPGGGEGDPGVFNYVFFIDNVGWFSGVNCDFNGDIGANLDVDLKYSSIRLQGDAYAGGECTSKKLYKSYDWGDYGNQSFAGKYFGDKVRPMLYADGDRSNTNLYYPQGYAEGVNFYEEQELYELPFVGPLSDYEEYAIEVGGTVSDSNKVVSGVWGDDAGEDAGITTNSLDDGCLVLIGTTNNPINLAGVVVAQKDIYIKGCFTGQGTLYAGRNIFVLDDIVALDAPAWPHPDNNPDATAASNKTKDFLALCAKGSLIFGHHGQIDDNMVKAPFTQDHASDASDHALGYVTGHYANYEPFFNGDYTQPDGDGTELRTDGSLRHFYEPILGDADFNALGVSSWVGHFDCVLYANHLIAGDFSPNTIINGAFICRDEAVKRHGNLALNWDARLGDRSLDGNSFNPGLPGMMLPANQPLPSRTIQWAEVAP